MSCPTGTLTPRFCANTYISYRVCPIGMTSGEESAKCKDYGPETSSASQTSRSVSCPKGFFFTKSRVEGHKPDIASTVRPIGTYASERNSFDRAKCSSGISGAVVVATLKQMQNRCVTLWFSAFFE